MVCVQYTWIPNICTRIPTVYVYEFACACICILMFVKVWYAIFIHSKYKVETWTKELFSVNSG